MTTEIPWKIWGTNHAPYSTCPLKPDLSGALLAVFTYLVRNIQLTLEKQRKYLFCFVSSPWLVMSDLSLVPTDRRPEWNYEIHHVYSRVSQRCVKLILEKRHQRNRKNTVRIKYRKFVVHVYSSSRARDEQTIFPTTNNLQWDCMLHAASFRSEKRITCVCFGPYFSERSPVLTKRFET